MRNYMRSLVIMLFVMALSMVGCTKDPNSNNGGGVATTKPVVETSPIREITETGAVGSGVVTSEGGGSVIERGVCWSIQNNPIVSGDHVMAGAGAGSFSCEIVDLEPNTTYYVRAYAINSMGVGYGNEVNFTTLKGNDGSQPYKITVSADPSDGGCVSGGGNYESGESCTVTATPASGYTFTNWTESGQVVSGADASYTFSVQGNRALIAHFQAQTQIPTGAINGKFTVNSNGNKVYFSQGNLQYIGISGTWKFADDQWEIIGAAQGNSSQSATRDLFGWGTSGFNHGAVCYQPWSTSTKPTDYYAYGSYTYNLYDQTGDADWGHNAISNGGNTTNTWRTLTTNEWEYVFKTRSTISGIRYAKACVNNVYGVILLPDDWSTSYYTLNETNSSSANLGSNNITASQWSTLEQHGAVFLPAAGSRTGSSVYQAGYKADYWSASSHDNSDSYGAYVVYFDGGSLVPHLSSSRYAGHSVRLACDAQ